MRQECRELPGVLGRVENNSFKRLRWALENRNTCPLSGSNRNFSRTIARELTFLRVRDVLWARLASRPYPAGPLDRSRQRSREPGRNGAYTMGDSLRYWKLARQIERFIAEYAAGRLDEAAKTVAQIG